ncbi:MAG: serine hydrolase [Pseudomonadota bacterium]
MTDQSIFPLQRACNEFAAQPGEISIIVEGISHDGAARVNSLAQVPAASVMKLAIACAAVDDPGVDLGQHIDLRDLDETLYCSVMKAFDPTATLSLRELIGLMIIVSDNPATTSVLDYVPPQKVNAWLGANGLTCSSFSAGFTDRELSGRIRENLTTAQDCLTLLQRIYDPQSPYVDILNMMANNLRNDRIPKRLPDNAVVMHKTGTLNGLVHDIAIIESPVVSYYLLVLADQLPDTHKFAYDLAVFSEQIYEMMHQSTPR